LREKAEPEKRLKELKVIYSNRKYKGTHRAVRRAQTYARTYPDMLKCDIQRYFPSIANCLNH